MNPEQKIPLGEMRASGLRRLLVYCGDYKCAHSGLSDGSAFALGVGLLEEFGAGTAACASTFWRPTE